jgi:hypothetical protein
MDGRPSAFGEIAYIHTLKHSDPYGTELKFWLSYNFKANFAGSKYYALSSLRRENYAKVAA